MAGTEAAVSVRSKKDTIKLTEVMSFRQGF